MQILISEQLDTIVDWCTNNREKLDLEFYDSDEDTGLYEEEYTGLLDRDNWRVGDIQLEDSEYIISFDCILLDDQLRAYVYLDEDGVYKRLEVQGE